MALCDCKKSFLANMQYIDRIASYNAYLQTGMTIKVSEKNYKDTCKKFLLWKRFAFMTDLIWAWCNHLLVALEIIMLMFFAAIFFQKRLKWNMFWISISILIFGNIVTLIFLDQFFGAKSSLFLLYSMRYG